MPNEDTAILPMVVEVHAGATQVVWAVDIMGTAACLLLVLLRDSAALNVERLVTPRPWLTGDPAGVPVPALTRRRERRTGGSGAGDDDEVLQHGDVGGRSQLGRRSGLLEARYGDLEGPLRIRNVHLACQRHAQRRRSALMQSCSVDRTMQHDDDCIVGHGLAQRLQ